MLRRVVVIVSGPLGWWCAGACAAACKAWPRVTTVGARAGAVLMRVAVTAVVGSGGDATLCSWGIGV